MQQIFCRPVIQHPVFQFLRLQDQRHPVMDRRHGRIGKWCWAALTDCSFSCSRIKCVSYSPDSPDVFSVGICPKLLPDAVNHTLDFGIHAHRDIIPDCLIDLSFCKYLSRMLCKIANQAKFLIVKYHLISFTLYLQFIYRDFQTWYTYFLYLMGQLNLVYLAAIFISYDIYYFVVDFLK